MNVMLKSLGWAAALGLLAGCSSFRTYSDEVVSQAERQKLSLRHYSSPRPEGLGHDNQRYEFAPVEVKGLFAGLRASRYRYLQWEDAVPVFGEKEIEFLAAGLSEGLKRINQGERMAFSLRDENWDSLSGEMFIWNGTFHFLLWEYRNDQFYLQNRPPDSAKATWRLVPGTGQAYHQEAGSWRTTEYPCWLEIPISNLEEQKL